MNSDHHNPTVKHSIRSIIDIQSPLIWVEVSNAFLFYIIFNPI